VIQLVLHLHVCIDPAPTEPAAAGADSTAEPPHSVADSDAVGATPAETS
jgi:hypothetical protein